MNDISTDSLTNIVCPCSGTTVQQIKALITDGAESIDYISRMTGACSGCGGCEPDVEELFEAYTAAATAEPDANNAYQEK